MKAVVGRLLEGVPHDRLDAGWRRRAGLHQIGRILLENCRHGFSCRVALKRSPSRHQLVEHGTEAEDIGAVIDVGGAHLFRRHIAHSTQHESRFGAAGHRRHHRRSSVGPPDTNRFGQAEVEDLCAAVVRDEDVLRLQVAMDDAFVMRRRKAACDLDGDVDGTSRGRRSLGQFLSKRFALKQFRHDEVETALFTDVVHGQDVRMAQRGDGARFLFEPAQPVGIRGDRRRKNLDGDIAM